MSESRVPPDGVPDDEVLPCGRFLSEVWEAHDTGTAAQDPHLRTCPHCTAALRELTALDRFVEQARAADRPPRVPDRLTGTAARSAKGAADPFTARVMELVRLELRPGRALPLGRVDEDLWIVETAVAGAFRAVVDTLPGVRAGSCRVRLANPDEDGGRGPALVRIDVVTSLEHNLQEVADAVRHRIVDAAQRSVGVRVHAVDVTVADIVDDGGRVRGTTYTYTGGPAGGRLGTGRGHGGRGTGTDGGQGRGTGR